MSQSLYNGVRHVISVSAVLAGVASRQARPHTGPVQIHYAGAALSAAPSTQLIIGRESACDIVLDDPDRNISRRAAVLAFDTDTWTVQNTGRRTFHLVEPSGEIEVGPTTTNSTRRIVHQHCWLRFPSTKDHAVVLVIPDHELPSPTFEAAPSANEHTIEETTPTFTENELRSLRAIYEGYLRLPPHYTRRPNSFRAVAVRLGVEQGKVKADHRRAIEKVIAAGGPTNAHTNRDGLVAWLLSRRVLEFDYTNDS